MPFSLLKAKGRNKYFVVDTHGHVYSNNPLTKAQAEKQLTALHIHTGHGHSQSKVAPLPIPVRAAPIAAPALPDILEPRHEANAALLERSEYETKLRSLLQKHPEYKEVVYRLDREHAPIKMIYENLIRILSLDGKGKSKKRGGMHMPNMHERLMQFLSYTPALANLVLSAAIGSGFGYLFANGDIQRNLTEFGIAFGISGLTTSALFLKLYEWLFWDGVLPEDAITPDEVAINMTQNPLHIDNAIVTRFNQRVIALGELPTINIPEGTIDYISQTELEPGEDVVAFNDGNVRRNEFTSVANARRHLISSQDPQHPLTRERLNVDDFKFFRIGEHYTAVNIPELPVAQPVDESGDFPVAESADYPSSVSIEIGNPQTFGNTQTGKGIVKTLSRLHRYLTRPRRIEPEEDEATIAARKQRHEREEIRKDIQRMYARADIADQMDAAKADMIMGEHWKVPMYPKYKDFHLFGFPYHVGRVGYGKGKKRGGMTPEEIRAKRALMTQQHRSNIKHQNELEMARAEEARRQAFGQHLSATTLPDTIIPAQPPKIPERKSTGKGTHILIGDNVTPKKISFVKKYLKGQGLPVTDKNVHKVCNIMDTVGVVFE